MPVAEFCRLVFVIAKANDGLRLALRPRPAQIGGRVVNRVAAEHHQCLDLAGVQRLREVGNHFFLRFRRVEENDCLADVAERGVDRVNHEMNRLRLAMAGNHQ